MQGLKSFVSHLLIDRFKRCCDVDSRKSSSYWQFIAIYCYVWIDVDSGIALYKKSKSQLFHDF